jgi:hypothetical protein
MILQKQLFEEIELIPAEKYAEIYDFLHYFRLGLSQTEQKTERKPGLFKGQLGNAFFEPLPEEELKAWETDI